MVWHKPQYSSHSTTSKNVLQIYHKETIYNTIYVLSEVLQNHHEDYQLTPPQFSLIRIQQSKATVGFPREIVESRSFVVADCRAAPRPRRRLPFNLFIPAFLSQQTQHVSTGRTRISRGITDCMAVLSDDIQKYRSPSFILSQTHRSLFTQNHRVAFHWHNTFLSSLHWPWPWPWPLTLT